MTGLRQCPRCGGRGVVDDRRVKVSPDERAKIIALSDMGVPGSRLARLCGVHESTISRIVRSGVKS